MNQPLIIAVMLAPERALALDALDWDLLIRQSKRSNLASSLAARLAARDLLDQVPAAPRRHLQSAMKISARQRAAARWEIECIAKALRPCGVPVVLLKGAAYHAADLGWAQSRLFSDVDILVPKAALPAVETALMLSGWRMESLSDYDLSYYRRWMHELPPMRHARRDTTIDVHHALLPDTARIKVDTPALLARAQPLAGQDLLQILQPVDLLLHSASHLFHEGELGNGLRDLFDLDGLMRHFGRDPAFWQQLPARAQSLGLQRPLYYALRYSAAMLGTPIPAQVQQAVAAAAPMAPLRALMDFAYRRALLPLHASCDRRGTAAARFMLYVRSHWLRMPVPLLLLHFTRKLLLRATAPRLENVPPPHQHPEAP